jgi:2-keto-4-pentenoate hydratase/2-oxohepta-3-ene-1,7-dioic acid hydratase in catechol pathway
MVKLARYVLKGRPSFGLVTPRGIIDLGRRAGLEYSSLGAFLASGAAHRAQEAGAPVDVGLEEVQFLPPVGEESAIFCVGLNYADHARETGRKLPNHPSTFIKLPRTLLGHQQPLRRPKVSHLFDWEAELAIVIGRHARHVRAADALAYVAGYTCVNDGTIRDWQLERDVTQGKNFLASGACGPWLVTRDEIADPTSLTVMSRLNGVEMQRASISQLIFSVPHLVAYYSTLTELRPGDLISTGTPGGVGHRREPKIYMQPGDVIEVEITGIGVLRNRVEDE